MPGGWRRRPIAGRSTTTSCPASGTRRIGKAIFWFDVHEDAATVAVLGVFFGGQEHRIAMLRRLLED
jgi:hypothetical protein